MSTSNAMSAKVNATTAKPSKLNIKVNRWRSLSVRRITDVLNMTVEEGLEFFFKHPPRRHPARCRTRLRQTRTNRTHPLRRRSPTSQTRHRTLQTRHRQNPLSHRRTHHRTVILRCPQAPRRAAKTS
jgi:hypothetical protein